METRTAPRAGAWHLLPETADVAFAGRATRFSPTVRARFTSVSGRVVAGGCDSVEVDVDVSSMTSGNRAWDDLVAAVDPFDAARHPVARYRSTRVVWSGSAARVDGLLELRGVVRPVQLQASHLALGGDRLRVGAVGVVDRDAFGVRCDIPGAALIMPRRLELAIEVVAVHEDALLLAA